MREVKGKAKIAKDKNKKLMSRCRTWGVGHIHIISIGKAKKKIKLICLAVLLGFMYLNLVSVGLGPHCSLDFSPQLGQIV